MCSFCGTGLMFTTKIGSYVYIARCSFHCAAWYYYISRVYGGATVSMARARFLRSGRESHFRGSMAVRFSDILLAVLMVMLQRLAVICVGG